MPKMIKGVLAMENGIAPEGWTEIQGDDDSWEGDDLDAAREVRDALREDIESCPIYYYAPAVGALLDTDSDGFDLALAALDKIELVRESCPSWIVVLPTKMARRARLCR